MARWTDITAFLASSPKILAFTGCGERIAHALLATSTGQPVPVLLDNGHGDWLHIVTPLTPAAKRYARLHGTKPGTALTRWDGEWVLHHGIHQPGTTPELVLNAMTATINAAHPSHPEPLPVLNSRRVLPGAKPVRQDARESVRTL